MKNPIHNPGHAQKGFTLVELMISLVLGLILMGATFQIFMITKNSQRLQNGIADVQENGRYAIYALRENILMAGFSLTGGISPFDPGNSNDDDSDQISVRYQSNVDCLGAELPLAANGIAVNRLFVDTTTSTLRCDGNGGDDSPALTLVEGIESMQVLYGLDDSGNKTANRYITATEVPDWDDIVSVRIALLARSQYKIGAREENNYYLLDAPAIAKDDALAHRIFSTTIPLRNNM